MPAWPSIFRSMTHAMKPNELLDYLRGCSLVPPCGKTTIRPLNGGISSAIYLIEEGGRRFVTKQALAQLRVTEEWHCDTSRNFYEQEFLAWANDVKPGVAPEILFRDRKNGLFAMEYLDGWSSWKTRLWEGNLDREIARKVGQTLGNLHRAAWLAFDLCRQFDNTPLFEELRISPYFRFAARKYPEWSEYIETECKRLASKRLTLVHGDYSPKNLMTNGTDVKILDAEVAWFGDPAFDVAFLSTHLLLKSIRFSNRSREFLELQRIFTEAYQTQLGAHWETDLEVRSIRLTLLLLLARISGKSPVEYLSSDSAQARKIIAFVFAHLNNLPETFAGFRSEWAKII